MATPIPPNDAPFTLVEVLGATGGRLCGVVPDDLPTVLRGDTPHPGVRGVTTDSRRVRPGEAFVALGGDRFDGHDHLPQAVAAGARLLVVERAVPAPEGVAVVRVPCTLEALGALARDHLARWRRRTGGTVVAVTGSAGKTTTKDALAALLGEHLGQGAVLATVGNLNNRIGVPMTALQLGDAHRCAVLELGTNAPGEIGALRDVCRPDVAAITLIAAAHTEGLGSLDAVAREKTALWSRLGPAGVAVGNADDARVAASLAACAAGRRLGFGSGEGADYRIVRRAWLSLSQSELDLRRPDGSMLTVQTAYLGRAGALACAAALALAETVSGEPLPAELVSRVLCRPSPSPGRFAPRALAGERVLLDDSYNSNPASCRASIEAAMELSAWLGRELVLVLGAMRELGALGDAAHAEIGTLAAEVGARRVIAVGEGAEPLADAARRAGADAVFTARAQDAAPLACEALGPSQVVLVKGSRGVHTELIVDALVACYPGAARGGGAPLRHVAHHGASTPTSGGTSP